MDSLLARVFDAAEQGDLELLQKHVLQSEQEDLESSVELVQSLHEKKDVAIQDNIQNTRIPIDALNDRGCTMFHVASNAGRIDVMNFLLDTIYTYIASLSYLQLYPYTLDHKMVTPRDAVPRFLHIWKEEQLVQGSEDCKDFSHERLQGEFFFALLNYTTPVIISPNSSDPLLASGSDMSEASSSSLKIEGGETASLLAMKNGHGALVLLLYQFGANLYVKEFIFLYLSVLLI